MGINIESITNNIVKAIKKYKENIIPRPTFCIKRPIMVAIQEVVHFNIRYERYTDITKFFVSIFILAFF